jgi:hypothetical protein
MKTGTPILKPILKATSVIAGVLSVSIVVGYVYVDVQDPSPGPLTAPHARIPELAGAAHCAACHGSDSVSMGDACLACHSEIRDDLTTGRAVHGRLDTTTATRCWQCHSEHHGEGFQMTNRRSFELAGIPKVADFDHAGLSFQLAGVHELLGCDECHRAARHRILPVGMKRFAGLAQQCQSCHDDVHQGAYGSDCASCHGQTGPFARVGAFQHSDIFLLRGAHDNLECQRCHEPGTEYAVQNLLAQKASAMGSPPPLRTCASCHESPHRPGFTRLVAEMLSLQADDTCQVCHADVHGSFHLADITSSRNLHEWTGFSLATPHDHLDCQSCHAETVSAVGSDARFAARFPGRHQDDCRACHGDPHRGQFDSGSQAGKRCIDCHDRHQFLPSQFTAITHEATAFPIHGAHSRLECSACHKQQSVAAGEAVAQVRQFQGTATSCAECHQDPHYGQFGRGAFGGQECSACHDDRDFDHPTFTQQQHDLTGFPLTGGHAAVGCRQCHAALSSEELAPLQAKYPDGLVNIRFQGTSRKCSACHADVHGGAFDRPGVPAAVGSKTGCARCHSTESFRDSGNDPFDHELWTGYRLAGVHAALQCAACHQRSARPDASGRSLAMAAGRNCQDCHRDPHVGQFGPTASVDCSRCHSQQNTFANLLFDHQRDSAFPLDKQHSGLACRACHRPVRLAAGQEAIRYKPLGTACADCHLPRAPHRPGGSR